MKQIIQSDRFVAFKEWYLQHEQQLMPVALLGGFIFDLLTVARIDRLYENILLVMYMLIAAGAIAIMHLYDTGRLTAAVGNVRHERILMWLRLTAPFIIQFAFGGLFSVFLVLYSQAGSFMVSWVFLLLLAGLAVGNELFREAYQRFEIQVGILFFCIFLFSIFFLPILFLRISTVIFLLSGILSLALIGLFLTIFEKMSPALVLNKRYSLAGIVIGIFALVNLFYFTSALPPLPLSIQEAEIAHSVQRVNPSQYQIQTEDRPYLRQFAADWIPFVPDRIHILPGQPVYFFSSVFAPTDLILSITHYWEYYDPERRDWMDAGRISFPLRGGRDEGYRGYSLKQNIFSGSWRVSVLAEDGRVISRKDFVITIVNSGQSIPPLQVETR